MSEQRVRTALRALADTAPVHPDVLAVMRRSRQARRPRFVPVLAASVIVLTVFAVAFVVRTSVRGPDPAIQAPVTPGPPTIPEVFPPYSFLQGGLRGAFGRAAAVYVSGTGHEDFSFHQVIVAGADSDSYRRVGLPSTGEHGFASYRLAPDGTALFHSGDAGSVVMLDLLTGKRREYEVPGAAAATPVALSADGRHVACLLESRGAPGSLVLLDVASGHLSPIAGEAASAVAFSPDGTMLAVQTGDLSSPTVRIVGVDGAVRRSMTPPAGTMLAGAQAWTPDGKHLVGLRIDAEDSNFVLLDAAGSGEVAARPVPGDLMTPQSWGDAVLGWRSPTVMLTSVGEGGRTTSNLIVEVDVTTGASRVVSRFTTEARDDLAVGGVQLATGLLPDLATRKSADPDRGSWPAWAQALRAIGILLVLAGAAGLLWWHRRRGGRTTA